MIFKASLVVLLIRFLSFEPAQAQKEQNYVDNEDGLIKSFDPNEEVQVRIRNKSNYRADVYWDNGGFGAHMFTLSADESRVLNSYVGESFFVTRHGVKEGLFDPETDTQYRFDIQKPNHFFEIPESAAPSINPCHDRFSVCPKIAGNGGCHENPGWMIVHCCVSCDAALNSSRLIDPKIRCSREHLNTTETCWGPGDLHRLFSAWATIEEFKIYEPLVLSSPKAEYGGKDGPWVIIFDNFVADEEADALIEGGEISGFGSSTTQGSANSLGEREKTVSSIRTSSNAWCNGACQTLPGVKSVTAKIERVTGIPRKNYEAFQILNYDPGAFYRRHHDESPGKPRSPGGPRIMTFFLYLSDVEEGGATRFNELGIDVEPKKGRALVWPSVLDLDPEKSDPRMYHEAMAVTKGKKYAANHWIHIEDIVTPHLWGCTGSFS